MLEPSLPKRNHELAWLVCCIEAPKMGWKGKRPVGVRASLPQGILYQRFDCAKERRNRPCAGATAIGFAEGGTN